MTTQPIGAHKLLEQTMELLPERCIFWHEEHTLILSDLHLGKITHFRKHGIAAPSQVRFNELERLTSLLVQYQPKRVIIVGDLFHSDLNPEWDLFVSYLKPFNHIEWLLVRGNHDSLPAFLFKDIGFKVSASVFLQPFLFIHHPETNKQHYVISGHIHPGVRLSGKGKQYLKLPCFYFGEKFALLPAFGTFTGLATVDPSPHDSVYAIANNQIIQL